MAAFGQTPLARQISDMAGGINTMLSGETDGGKRQNRLVDLIKVDRNYNDVDAIALSKIMMGDNRVSPLPTGEVDEETSTKSLIADFMQLYDISSDEEKVKMTSEIMGTKLNPKDLAALVMFINMPERKQIALERYSSLLESPGIVHSVGDTTMGMTPGAMAMSRQIPSNKYEDTFNKVSRLLGMDLWTAERTMEGRLSPTGVPFENRAALLGEFGGDTPRGRGAGAGEFPVRMPFAGRDAQVSEREPVESIGINEWADFQSLVDEGRGQIYSAYKSTNPGYQGASEQLRKMMDNIESMGRIQYDLERADKTSRWHVEGVGQSTYEPTNTAPLVGNYRNYINELFDPSNTDTKPWDKKQWEDAITKIDFKETAADRLSQEPVQVSPASLNAIDSLASSPDKVKKVIVNHALMGLGPGARRATLSVLPGRIDEFALNVKLDTIGGVTDDRTVRAANKLKLGKNIIKEWQNNNYYWPLAGVQGDDNGNTRTTTSN